MSIYTNPLVMQQDGHAPKKYTGEQLQTMFADQTGGLKRTYDEYTFINKRQIDPFDLSTVIR